VEGYQLSDSSDQEAVPPDVSSRSLVAGHSPSRRAERNSGSVSGLDSLKADLERRGATGTLSHWIDHPAKRAGDRGKR